MVDGGGRGRKAPSRVTVALATYRRPSDLEKCLPALRREAVAAQSAHQGLAVEVLVVDNDSAESGREIAERYAEDGVRYVVEPTPGISAARNKALDESPASDVLVFVDDDEEPLPGWLRALLAAYSDYDVAAVAGRVVSAFDGPQDPWVEAGGFFRRRSLPTGTPITVAATNNLLLDLAVVRSLGLRFEPRYGLTGGGDHHFTRALVRGGGSMIWCDEAVVLDRVPRERMTRSWVLARQRRTGNSDVVVDIDLADGYRGRLTSRARGAARGAIRLGGGALMRVTGTVVRSLAIQARGAKAIARGQGMMSGALGRRVSEYDRAAEAEPPTKATSG